jgi:hypothetical protein
VGSPSEVFSLVSWGKSKNFRNIRLVRFRCVIEALRRGGRRTSFSNGYHISSPSSQFDIILSEYLPMITLIGYVTRSCRCVPPKTIHIH